MPRPNPFAAFVLLVLGLVPLSLALQDCAHEARAQRAAPTWIQTPNAAALGFYGDGSDGAAVFGGSTVTGATLVSKTYTLQRDVVYSSCVVNATYIVNQSGWHMFCGQSLLVNSGGTIQNNGGNGSGSTGGAAASAFTLGTGGISAGGTGATGAAAGTGSTAESQCMGGSGGNGGAATNAGGTAGTCTAPPISSGTIRTAFGAVYATPTNLGNSPAMATGGGGGGGSAAGAVGGGGGGGGGYCLVVAYTLTNNGVIEALGGNGAAGSGSAAAGGGGGGGGGVVFSVSHFSGGTGTYSAAGGSPGAGNLTGSAGVAGSTGQVFHIPD